MIHVHNFLYVILMGLAVLTERINFSCAMSSCFTTKARMLGMTSFVKFSYSFIVISLDENNMGYIGRLNPNLLMGGIMSRVLTLNSSTGIVPTLPWRNLSWMLGSSLFNALVRSIY